MKKRTWIDRLVKGIIYFGIFLTVAVCILWWLTKPTAPDAFYSVSGVMPSSSGSIIRVEPFTRQVPQNAKGWRVLYTTTKFDGTIAPASAIVLAPKVSSGLPSNVVAWTHGTTGVAPPCAPSVMAEPFANVPALEDAIAEGWVVVATDYIGLGTEGPHPYLIGEGQARSALDSLRAVRQIKELSLTDKTVVWGHSQGGNAAIWTGILAPVYASEQKIDGIAAAAPATDLIELVLKAQGTPVGKILSSYIATAYSSTYPDVVFDEIISPGKRWLVRDIATRCMSGKEALFMVAESLVAGNTIFSGDPTVGTLGKRLRENTPDKVVNVPLLIAQGENDELVLFEIQKGFVDRQCSAGQSMEFFTYTGLDHLKIVGKESAYNKDLIQWTRDRFENKTAPKGCVHAIK